MAGISLTIAGFHRTFGPELDHYVDVAEAADEVGVDQIVLAEHVVMGPATDAYPYGEFAFEPSEPWPDPLVLLTAIAAVTSRIRLGTGILISPLRTPASLAKTIATLDAYSGGRVDLGVGTGWQREEYDVAGVPWEERWQRLDDGLRACRDLWSGTYPDRWCEPRPAQDRLPIWLGAKATRKNCARVADWGDGWMPLEAQTGSDELFDGIAALRAAFTDAGRSPDELLVRSAMPFVRGDDGFDFGATREAALRLRDAGVTHFSVNLRRSIASAEDARAFLEQLAEGLLPIP